MNAKEEIQLDQLEIEIAKEIKNIFSTRNVEITDALMIIRSLYLSSCIGVMHTIGDNAEMKEQFIKFHYDMVDEILRGEQASKKLWNEMKDSIDENE